MKCRKLRRKGAERIPASAVTQPRYRQCQVVRGAGIQVEINPDDPKTLTHAVTPEGQHPRRANKLLPPVYNELRQLAAKQMAHEKPGQTLDPTALVHEAYLRLVDRSQQKLFANRRHFFAAAAEVMRRMLVEKARRKQRNKHGDGPAAG